MCMCVSGGKRWKFSIRTNLLSQIFSGRDNKEGNLELQLYCPGLSPRFICEYTCGANVPLDKSPSRLNATIICTMEWHKDVGFRREGPVMYS